MSRKELTEEEIFELLDKEQEKKQEGECGECGEECASCVDSICEKFSKEMEEMDNAADWKKSEKIYNMFSEILITEKVDSLTFIHAISCLFYNYISDEEDMEYVLSKYLSYIAVKVNGSAEIDAMEENDGN